MFNIVIADGKNEMPDDDIYYVVGKEGIFIKKKLGIMESLSPVKNISILESVQATAKMHIAKIPGILTAKISNFFKEVQKEHRSEAIVLLFYNEETKKYKVVPPAQKVSAASLDYNRSIIIDGWTMIGDIHSHSSMSAFHSGVDQGDEESFDGLHITFGNMNAELISISASIVSNGHRTMVLPEDYMNGIFLDHEIDEIEKIPTTRVYKWEDGKMIESTPKYSATTYRSYRRYDKRYKILSEQSAKAKCPSAWMKTVEYKTFTYGYQGTGSWYGGWQGSYQGGRWEKGKWIPASYNNKWGKNFDSGAWDKHRRPGQTAADVRKNAPPQNVGVKVDPIKFPEHDQGPVVTDVTPSRYMPCKNCAFKEKAIEYVAELLVDENEGTIEEGEIFVDKEVYECTKCNIVVSFEYDDKGEIEGEIICPSCKVDEHLMLIDDLAVEAAEAAEDIIEETGLVGDGYISCKTCSSRFSISMLK
jgi:PRTRC genetic system protein A